MIEIEDQGTNNTLLVVDGGAGVHDGRVVARGNGSRVEIARGVVGVGLSLEVGDDCRVSIGEGCNLGNLFIYAAKGASILIGAGCGFNGHVRLLAHETGRILIGNGCLIANDVDITLSDMHSMVDAVTGKRLNPARDVILEDRVWIGARAMVLKGAHVGGGSVIGACSVVTGRLPANCMAAGSPARPRRSGVTWRHDLI